ncbi:hypothetical protein SAMN05428967_0428 [Phyllobacterium sp. YR620]|uniref:hypothetical protein n=1 Tax=Phyllobacterium sp. YR620 TaxID=1881066 RepID=UPI000888E1E6|nr:hypothetical protein [Phyllobacterium sp. YR620]SDO88173.1 hypothetical protein SAMN05428967_0428 [Phyllobacterium sp. YR620]
MTRYFRIATAASLLYGITVASSQAQAAEPKIATEGQGISTVLGADASAVTYWVKQPDGWHVVTTVGTNGADNTHTESRAVARFSAVLLPGQSQSISVPAELGKPQSTLLIRRVADRIEVETNSDLVN